MVWGFILGLPIGALLMCRAVEDMQAKINALKEDNKELKAVRLLEVRNSTKISKQNNKKTELISKIKELLEINKYGNEKAVLSKIKELVHDYQSKN